MNQEQIYAAIQQVIYSLSSAGIADDVAQQEACDLVEKIVTMVNELNRASVPIGPLFQSAFTFSLNTLLRKESATPNEAVAAARPIVQAMIDRSVSLAKIYAQ